MVRALEIWGVGLLLLPIAGCGPPPEPPAFHPSTPAEAAAMHQFQAEVKPIFQGNCYRCHFGMNHKGKFNLDTRALLLKGGDRGVAVVPGHPDQSLLLRLVRHQGPADHPMPMPPKDKLSDGEIEAISRWIADGAIMDR